MSELGQGLIDALKEARQHAQGKIAARTTKYNVPSVKIFEPQEVKSIRNSLGYSQTLFALILGVSPKTIEAWESGKNTPNGTSSRLLEIIQKAPDTLHSVGLV
ncbi:MAG: helix-turn-helix domain-containing protein [Firmicutes bacterium]|nr:helix-turn-helix domain-containing protein [Bacillota bacterium]